MSDALGLGSMFAAIALTTAATAGWVLNIIKIFDPISGLWIMRVAGVFFFPIGCIVGWL